VRVTLPFSFDQTHLFSLLHRSLPTHQNNQTLKRPHARPRPPAHMSIFHACPPYRFPSLVGSPPPPPGPLCHRLSSVTSRRAFTRSSGPCLALCCPNAKGLHGHPTTSPPPLVAVNQVYIKPALLHFVRSGMLFSHRFICIGLCAQAPHADTLSCPPTRPCPCPQSQPCPATPPHSPSRSRALPLRPLLPSHREPRPPARRPFALPPWPQHRRQQE